MFSWLTSVLFVISVCQLYTLIVEDTAYINVGGSFLGCFICYVCVALSKVCIPPRFGQKKSPLLENDELAEHIELEETAHSEDHVNLPESDGKTDAEEDKVNRLVTRNIYPRTRIYNKAKGGFPKKYCLSWFCSGGIYLTVSRL